MPLCGYLRSGRYADISSRHSIRDPQVQKRPGVYGGDHYHLGIRHRCYQPLSCSRYQAMTWLLLPAPPLSSYWSQLQPPIFPPAAPPASIQRRRRDKTRPRMHANGSAYAKPTARSGSRRTKQRPTADLRRWFQRRAQPNRGGSAGKIIVPRPRD